MTATPATGYEFDGWYDYNRWVDYLGTKDTKGVEVASNTITRLASVKTSTTDSSVTVIYGMVKGYKTTTGNNATNNNNSVNTGTADPTNPKTGEEVERVCEENQPFAAQVFKTMADPFVGKMSLMKVMSGSLTGDMLLYNSNAEKTEKPGTISILKGKKPAATQKVCAGDIFCLAKLGSVATGHTLCDGNNPVKFAEIEFPAPCISKAVYAKKAGEEDKIFSGLNRLMEEDLTIRVEKNVETTESVLSGLGETHIEVIAKKLATKFGAECVLQDPKIPYRESIRKPVDVQGRHKKQSGGHGQFGDVHIRFEPQSESEEMIFADETVGGCVPKNFIPSVEKGLRNCVGKGVLAGYPVVFLKATLFFGSYHDVDSSATAYEIAGSMAFKAALEKANPVLMEPVMKVEIIVPEQYMGDVMGNVSSRRGRVDGMEARAQDQIIHAFVPLSEMFGYATDLRSRTQGRGQYSMEPHSYVEIPKSITDKIVEKRNGAAQ